MKVFVKSRTVLGMGMMHKVTVLLTVLVGDLVRVMVNMTRCTMSEMMAMIVMTAIGGMVRSVMPAIMASWIVR